MRKSRLRYLLVAAVAAATLPAVPASADPYDRLAKGLTRDVPGLRDQKAAVMPFVYIDGRISPGGALVGEQLATSIAERGGLVLVERGMIDKALEEIRLSYSGAVSPESAQKAGKIVGARFLVVGTLADDGTAHVEVNARLIETETGVVVSGAKARLKRTWIDSEAGKPGAEPFLAVKTVTVPPQGEGDAVLRQFGTRRLAFRYGNAEGRPHVSVSDVTDPAAVSSVDVSMPYDAEANRFGAMTETFRIGGRRYRFWSGVWKPERGPVLHVAPAKGMFGSDIDDGEETVIEFMELIERWTKDVDRRGQDLGSKGGTHLIAYFERLPKRRLRASLWTVRSDMALLQFPAASAVVDGRPGEEAASRIVVVGPRHFRFRYNFDKASVSVEEIQ